MRSRSERMSLLRAGVLLGLVATFGAMPVGCSDDAKLPNATSDGGAGTGGFGGVATGPCSDGASRSCGIELAKHGSIASCYLGKQTCNGGVWSECTDGKQVTKSIVPPPGVGPASAPQNSLGNCVSNPCDPYCNIYNDDAGVTTDGGTPIFNWQAGDPSDLPPGLVNQGIQQPCEEAADCQFNTYCWHPRTAACGHSKCEAGAKLNYGCDPCVKQVCKTDQTCCTYQHTCNHSPCTAGGYLTPGCDNQSENCVTKVCASAGLAHCCQNAGPGWDAACVAAVTSVCGLSCPLTPAGTWTAACVGKVESVCGAECGTGSPPPEEGQCKEWIPGQTDPACGGVDLSVDVPCSGNVPVCNHGQTAAPAGIRIVHFPGSSGEFGKCNPDQTHPQMEECFTTQPIPPGMCTTQMERWDGSAWVPGCSTLGGNVEIMVNPQVQSGKPTPAAYPGYVAECKCQDNWSIYHNGACGLPTCGSQTQTGVFKKPNFYIIMDRTGSMVSSGIWNPAVTGMTAFFQDPGAAGLGIALEFFSLNSGGIYGDGCAPGNCVSAPCGNPMVPLGTLTAAPAPGDTHEAALVATFANVHPNAAAPGTGFGTRIYPALEGALTWATSHVISTPTEDFHVILLTDGDPSACDTSSANNAALSAAALAAHGIKTYVIAMPGSTLSFLDPIAAAGGTTAAINVTAAGMAAQMVAALSAIASSGITCNFDLPAAGLFDPANVQVVFTPSSGPSANLSQVTDLVSCAGGPGWYYDNNTTPTKISLCPQSCTTAQGDSGSKVDYTLGCPTGAGPKTVYVPYEGVCPAGSKPVWNFFTYSTTTPGNSTIDFRVRAADTQANLPSGTWHNLAQAHSTPTDTQNCGMGGPAPCPIDLYAALGFPDQKRQWLELEVTLTPAAGLGPVLTDVNLTYSCPPSE